MSISLPSDFDQQYRDLCRGVGVVLLDNWSSVTVTGQDRQKFLQNFCTNDVLQLSLGDAREAFFLNVKGKIVGHGLVTCREDAVVFVGPPGQSRQLIAHLDRYVIREDVQLRDSTDERKLLLRAGPADVSAVSFAWNLIGNDRSRLFDIPADELPQFTSALQQRGLTVLGSLAFETARIEAGFPLFGCDFNEEHLPQEIGRDSAAISFHKGCYLGQETVARIDALGHVNRQIVGVRFSGDDLPPAGSELTQPGLVAGVVSSATFSPKLAAPLALAMVRREATAPGTRLDSKYGECEVLELPLRI